MKYTNPEEREWVKPKMKGYRIMCCDCGLVHEFDFKVIKWGRGHKVLFRSWRHERATAGARKRKQAKR